MYILCKLQGIIKATCTSYEYDIMASISRATMSPVRYDMILSPMVIQSAGKYRNTIIALSLPLISPLVQWLAFKFLPSFIYACEFTAIILDQNKR